MNSVAVRHVVRQVSHSPSDKFLITTCYRISELKDIWEGYIALYSGHSPAISVILLWIITLGVLLYFIEESGVPYWRTQDCELPQNPQVCSTWNQVVFGQKLQKA